MKSVTFDPAAIVTIYHRTGRAGSKTLVFANADGTPYSILGIAFQFLVKRQPGADAVITLTVGSGLAISGADNNELTISFTELQNFLPTTYFYELYNSTIKKTWLNGDFIVHAGKFNSFSGSETVTVTTGENIEVTITDSTISTIDGGTP